MWIKTKRLTNAATAAYGLLGFVFERLLGFAHQASSPVISQKLDGRRARVIIMAFVKASYGHLARRSAATLIEPIAHHLLMANRLA
jgi:hypothetical protein